MPNDLPVGHFSLCLGAALSGGAGAATTGFLTRVRRRFKKFFWPSITPYAWAVFSSAARERLKMGGSNAGCRALGPRGRATHRARVARRSAPLTTPPNYTRASTLLTDLACQAPPRAVPMPRAFNASAIWCSDRAPARCISRITGNTLAAW